MNTPLPAVQPPALPRARVTASARLSPLPPRSSPPPLRQACPKGTVEQDLKARPILTLQDYLRQFTNADGDLIVEDSHAQCMIADGRLPAYKSAGVWLVRATEPLPMTRKATEAREPLTVPSHITLIEWGTALIASRTYPTAQARERALAQARHTIHDWRKRGRISPEDLYQSRSNYLIRREAVLLPPPPPRPRRRHRRRP